MVANDTSRVRLLRCGGAVVCILFAMLTGCVSAPHESDDFSATPPPDPKQVTARDGAIYHAASHRLFFEDIRARRQGDVINVILDERTDATKTASTSSNKGSSIDLPSPRLFGAPLTLNGRELLSADVSSSRDFQGSADSSQSNRLNGSVAVTVERVLANGNLWIRGQKMLTLNQGSEVVRVAGLIRAADIAPNNTILSTQIADASITYGGRGLFDDSNRPGWLTRFFSSPMWPF